MGTAIEVRKATAEEYRAFCKLVCEEDLNEIEVAFHTPRSIFADVELNDGNLIGIWIVWFNGEPGLCVGLYDCPDAPVKTVSVFTHTSVYFYKYRKSYVSKARDVLGELIFKERPDTDWVVARVWEKHRVWRTIRRLFGAEEIARENEVVIARLLEIELDVKWYGMYGLPTPAIDFKDVNESEA